MSSSKLHTGIAYWPHTHAIEIDKSKQFREFRQLTKDQIYMEKDEKNSNEEATAAILPLPEDAACALCLKT